MHLWRSRGVTVSTLDSESSDPSSNLGETCFLLQQPRYINNAVVNSTGLYFLKNHRIVFSEEKNVPVILS